MTSVLLSPLAAVSSAADDLSLAAREMAQGGGPTLLVAIQWLAAGVVLAAALIIVRLHHQVMDECQHLRDQMARADEGQVKLQALLADVLATLNLTIASSESERGDGDDGETASLRAAMRQAIAGTAPLPLSADPPPEE